MRALADSLTYKLMQDERHAGGTVTGGDAAADRPPDRRGQRAILVEPQLGQNIGATAQAMMNCGLTDLRLVAPRDGWPNEAAVAMASGADTILETARVSTPRRRRSATSLCLATTARPRDMAKTVLTPRRAAAELRAARLAIWLPACCSGRNARA